MFSIYVCIVFSVLASITDAGPLDYFGTFPFPKGNGGHGHFNKENAVAKSEVSCSSYRTPCSSTIFCDGLLLSDASLSEGFDTNNEIFRKSLKYSENQINENYIEFKRSNGIEGQVPDSGTLLNFTRQNFDDAQDVTETVPSDYKDETALMQAINSSEYRDLLKYLQGYWKTAFRVVSKRVEESPDRHSLIYTPNIFPVPGGQFQELYYWDTYWIITGLFFSDMPDTVKAIIENFLYLIEKLGFIPNGSRVYYLNRSQPPLLPSMMEFYLNQTKNFDFIQKHLPALEAEFKWFTDNRNVTFVKDGKTHYMFRYNTCTEKPRPEAFKSDYEIGKDFATDAERDQFYSDIKSATESGWDFSTRWIIPADGTNNGTLKDANTGLLVPVDLNAFLEKNARLISTWYFRSGDDSKGQYYKDISDRLQKSIYEVFWDEGYGSWFDYDLRNIKNRIYFYPSNLSPLWTGSYYPHDKDVFGQRAVNYLMATGIICRDGTPRYWGIPTSLSQSGQQWDLSNSWAPLNAFIIQGLSYTGNNEAVYVAKKLASVWSYQNYATWKNTSYMWEKYDAVVEAAPGQGGEYAVQTGFGWSNGFFIELQNTYRDLSPNNVKLGSC